MTSDPVRRLERALERTARRLTGGGLHPLEILERASSALEAGVRDGYAPNQLRIGLHPEDYRQYRPSLARLTAELATLIAEIEERQRYRRVGDLQIQFERDAQASAGTPSVEARFTDTRFRQEGRAAPVGATRRLLRTRGVALVLGDGARVKVTHTPFAIGRGPGNDLVLPSMAVSRNHAELVRTAQGYAIRDLGSRNGVVVEGERHKEVVLKPGMKTLVGDVEMWLEEVE